MLELFVAVAVVSYGQDQIIKKVKKGLDRERKMIYDIAKD
jgi:hypothetical protein